MLSSGQSWTVPRLSKAQYLNTMEGMTPIEEALPLPADFWSYVDSVDASDLDDFDFYLQAGEIAFAFRTTRTRTTTWPSSSDDSDVFLVVILTLPQARYLATICSTCRACTGSATAHNCRTAPRRTLPTPARRHLCPSPSGTHAAVKPRRGAPMTAARP